MSLLNDVTTIARTIAGHAVAAKNYNGRGKLYEMWIMFRIAGELKTLGSTVSLHNSDGTPLGNTFRLRGGPGGIHPASQGASNPGYIKFTTSGGSLFELHNSVEFLGRSNATHEFDICVISETIGSALRGKPTLESPEGHPLVGLECKQYGRSSVGIGEARSLLGQLFDCTNWGLGACTADNWGVAMDGGNLKTLHSMRQRCGKIFPALIAERGVSTGAKDLGTMFRLRIFENVYLTTPAATTIIAKELYNL